MRRLLLTLTLVSLGIISVAHGQTQQAVFQFRDSGTALNKVAEFDGRADSIKPGGRTTTFSGNVTFTFRESNIRVTAEQATFDHPTSELTLSGNVRMGLRSPR